MSLIVLGKLKRERISLCDFILLGHVLGVFQPVEAQSDNGNYEHPCST